MTKTARILLLTLLAAFAPSLAKAQTGTQSPPEVTNFVNVSVGAQLQTHRFNLNSTFPLYDEAATITGPQSVGKGFVFDASAGHRFWRNLFGAVGLSTFQGSGNAAGVASIPDPLFFGRFAQTPFVKSDLSQTTIAINLQAVWMAPLTDKIDASFALGWSLVHVKQEFPSVTVTPGTQTVSGVTATDESKWTPKAGTIGIDLSLKVTDRQRVGVFVRYAPGEVDLPSASKLKVGGVQIGVGARMHF